MNLSWKWYLKDLANVEKNGFNVFSCFSCGGGSSMGYKLAGFNVIGNCEIDHAMNKLYVANHHPKYNYNMDVREFGAIDNDKLPEELLHLDILDGSPPCFGAGAPVKTLEGYKPIEDVKVGDMVLTHLGRYRKVLAVMKKHADNVCIVKAQGVLPITVTKNHPFYVRQMVRRGHDWHREFDEPCWKPVGELTINKGAGGSTKSQDYLCFPVNQESKIPDWNGVLAKHVVFDSTEIFDLKKNLKIEEPGFWNFVGRYIGDGWRRKDRKAVIVCDSKDKREELQQVIDNAGFHAVVTEQRTTYRFEISNVELWEFLAQFGDGAENKFIPEFVLNLPKSLLEAFMCGYLSSDGHYLERDQKWRVSTVSLPLALGMQTVIAKLWGQPTTIMTKDNTGCVIEGREVNCRLAYDLAFFDNKRKQQHSLAEGNYLWIPYRKTEDTEPQDVYNLSVEDDESYTVFNLAVHNCSVFSSAGEREAGWNKEKQFREGQKMQRLDDLFFWFINIAKKLQPRAVIAENVKGLTAGNAKGYVNEIFKAFREAGYQPQMFLLNGATMGVPQRRERVFFVAQRNDLHRPKLTMSFHEKPILFGQVRTEHGVLLKEGSKIKMLLDSRKPTDRKLADINQRLSGKYTSFTNYIWSDDQVCGTIASGGSYFRMVDGEGMSKQDFINVQTFPQDYDFIDQSVQYVCGMSVPPLMMARVAHEVDRQWLRPGEGNA